MEPPGMRRQAIAEPASVFAGNNNPAAMGERARQGAQYSASKGTGSSRLAQNMPPTTA